MSFLESLNKDVQPIDLESFETFSNHEWVNELKKEYKKGAILAKSAIFRVLNDIENMNLKFAKEFKRSSFVGTEGRVKPENSFFKKLYNKCLHDGLKYGVTNETLNKQFREIYDLAGIRVACPYYDEVRIFIDKLIKPKLNLLGYATNLTYLSGCEDKDCLDRGDYFGYRSYHFYIKIPTVVSIYEEVELCICEVQVRSELQHVWAQKSRDLLYKRKIEVEHNKQLIIEDMKHISNFLRSADQFLISIRDRIGGKKPDDYFKG